MKLESCPLCLLVANSLKSDQGKYCVKAKDPEGGLVVVLIEHEGTPSREAVAEAMKLLGSKSGLVEDIRHIPGHWGIQVKSGDWSLNGKSIVHK